jgi:UDP:flavonoid glycosyltransferase YjiC (YdhE family)
MAGELSARGAYRMLRSEAFKRDFGNPFRFLGQLLAVMPTRFAPPTAEIWNADHAGAMVGMLNERLVRALCDALGELMVDYRADVVVDFWNPFACVAAKARRKPLVAVMQANAHPEGGGLIWWKEPPADLPTPVPALNRVLAGYGLAPIRKTEELCVGDLTLVLGMPETDPLPAGADVTYVGPILWQNPKDRLPDWADDLSREQPLIWVYSGNPRYAPVGTPVDSAVVLRACIGALADEDVQVVLSTGHHPLPREFSRLPANFRYAAYVPGLAMAARSDLLIHHGGYGSCQTGLYTGTPALIIPTFSEREGNARRVAAVGAGEFVLPTAGPGGWKKEVRAEEVRAKVRRLLADPAYAENARRISEKMRAYGGAAEAARLIEDLQAAPGGYEASENQLD